MGNAKCGMGSVEWGVWNGECGMGSVEFHIPHSPLESARWKPSLSGPNQMLR